MPSAEPRPLLPFLVLLTAVAAVAAETAPPGPRPPTRFDAAPHDRLVRPESRDETIVALVEAADVHALPVLEALLEGNLYLGPTILVDHEGTLQDALTGAPAKVDRDQLEQVTINNRLRRTLQRAVAALRLFSPSAPERLAAARVLQEDPAPEVLPAVEKALAVEKDAPVKEALRATAAILALNSPDAARRIAAVGELRGAHGKRLLVQRLEVEQDPAVRGALQDAIRNVDLAQQRAAMVGLLFSGLSLGSVLLLAALGLAITFGLMGVINMAHGELLMIGAYATWGVQAAFRGSAFFDWYLVAAVPASFLVAALVGALLELTVVRKLYGRPLETLLATWGVSLLLVQTVRVLFGAQNVEVSNPRWMSGGLALLPDLVLPWNRIVILLFSAGVLLGMWALLTRTRLGLLVRAVTQDRRRAAGLGVRTPRVDLLAFAVGSGIAGLGGCALSQIGNVGPELGQGYIVDSFMVVVLGGVGNLAGTAIAAASLGVVNKLLEPWAGAVMAKIVVLVFIILFIQRRPQGLFALRGRALEEG
ncbi:MAG: urea ABC transporter permease subunit UrtB [Myxococcaceae bacterium]